MVSTPLKNISQMGWLFPIYGKIENVPNHQPVGLSMFIMLYHDFTRWCQIFSKWSALWTMVYTEPRISWNDQGSSLMAPRNPRQRRKTVALGFKNIAGETWWDMVRQRICFIVFHLQSCFISFVASKKISETRSSFWLQHWVTFRLCAMPCHSSCTYCT